MFPAGLIATAIRLCAAGANAGTLPSSRAQNPYAIAIHTGATLTHQPDNRSDAEATVRQLLALGANFDAGPLAINGRELATYGITATSVFDPCTLANGVPADQPASVGTAATVAGVVALVRQAFAARITDTIRPMNASYGALHSWHKLGQAVDFVPAAGVRSIDRTQIRALMAANGIRILELLGPGDPGHANHWHIAFARPGQIITDPRQQEGDEDWIVTPAASPPTLAEGGAQAATARIPLLAETPPPVWDVFASARWHNRQGGGS